MRKYKPYKSKVFVDENGKVSFTTQSIQEARITIHNAMFNFMNKEITQLMKKHDAYVNKGESDKTYTTISTPSPNFDKDYTALMKKNKKKIIQHFKIEAVEEVQEEGPCWPGYKQVGTKMKNGKEVPNCVPIDEYVKEDLSFGFDTMRGANQFKRKFPDTKPVQIVKVDGKKKHIVTLTEPDMNFIKRIEKAAKFAAQIGVEEQK